MKKVEYLNSETFGFKCVSCNDNFVSSINFPLCIECLKFWELVLTLKVNNTTLFSKFFKISENQKFDELKSSFERNSNNYELKLGLGTRNARKEKNKVYHYIVLNNFKSQSKIKRSIGDYLCKSEESRRDLSFVSYKSNICVNCFKFYNILKNNAVLLDNFDSYKVYYDNYRMLINELHSINL